jgi:hypothetical protein
VAELRASDEDRNRAAALLRDHFAEGRLDVHELDERLERIYAARTTAELESVHADLPTPAPKSDGRRSELAREVVQQTGAAFVPFLVCTLVWLFSGASGGFWPAWVALIGIIPLVRNGWRLYGPAPNFAEVEADLARRGRRGSLPPPPPPPPRPPGP